MPRALASRKLWLAVACFSALMLAAFIPGCGTVQQRTAPVTDLSFNPEQNELYIGARSVSSVKGSGGFAVYEITKDHFIRMNRTTGFSDPNVVSVQYDTLSKTVFIIHSGSNGPNLLSKYDSPARIVRIYNLYCSMLTFSPDRFYFSSGSDIQEANRTGSTVTSVPVEIYPAGRDVNSTSISSMLWVNDCLYFSTWSPPMLIRWKDNVTTNITAQRCDCLAAGPGSRIFFGTAGGLGYYDSATGQVVNTSCSGAIEDLVVNARDNIVYAIQTNPRNVIVAYNVEGDMTSVLLDTGNCPPLSWGPTCIEFSATRNEIFIGTHKGLIIYNIVTKKYRTKTDKDGMPLIPSYYQGPGFEAVAAIAVIVAVVYIRKKRRTSS